MSNDLDSQLASMWRRVYNQVGQIARDELARLFGGNVRGGKLNGSAIGGSQSIPSSTLPLATSSAVGGVKVDGSTITASGGVISATLPPGTAIDSDSANIPAINAVQQGSDPVAPASGHRKIYAKSGGWYDEDSTGTVTQLGSVTSVAITVPGVLSVSGSPITSAGTFALTLATQSANRLFAGPSSGSAATPTFRAIVPADLPVFVASGGSHAVGAVPDPGSTSGTTHFLREDATWATIVSGIYAPLSNGNPAAPCMLNGPHGGIIISQVG